MAPFAVLALGVSPQAGAQDSEAPTPIERALIDRACNAVDAPPSAEPDARQHCLTARLVSLRGAFGRDLNRLTGGERRGIDAACGRLRAFERREPYLDCLSDQLGALRLRQNPGTRAPSENAAIAPPPMAAPSAAPVPPARAPSSSRSTAVIGGTLAGAIAAMAVSLLALKSRRPARTCRACGAGVSQAGLCAACRHEAAELRRRAVEARVREEESAQHAQGRSG